MAEIRRDSQVVVSKDTVSSTLDDEEVVLDARQGKYFGLNEVGRFVWTRIQSPARVSDLVDALLAEYEVEPEQAESDVLTLLGTLAEKGLIEVQNDGSPS